MSSLAHSNPGYYLKLSATSMGFSMAVAKLIAHFKLRQEEKIADDLFFQEMLAAYSDSEEELRFSEMLSGVSNEVDIILSNLRDLDE
jgi:hypothetical protein